MERARDIKGHREGATDTEGGEERERERGRESEREREN